MLEFTKILPLSPEELLTLDAAELSNLLSKGRITSINLVDQLLYQISREDRVGMNLRATLNVEP